MVETIPNQEDSEVFRDIRHPLTEDQLRPLGKSCWNVILNTSLNDKEHERLGEFLEDFPHATLTVSQQSGGFENFRFLQFYPTLKNLRALFLWDLASLDGIENLSANLECLELHKTKSRRFSLAFLRKFKRLKKLYLEGHSKDFDAVAELADLEDLTIRSITLPSLEPVGDLPNLWSLDIKLGGTTNLSALSRAKSLKYLELWMIRGLADISFVSEITNLQYLFLQDLKNVTILPHFGKLNKLRRITLVQMKGISDLTPLSHAESLEDIAITGAPLLSPEAFVPLKMLRSLKTIVFGSGRSRKNQVEAMFPNLKHHLSHPFIYH